MGMQSNDKSFTPAVEAQLSQLQNQLNSIGPALIEASNVELMFDLVSKFVESPALYEEFKHDPEAVVKREISDFNAPGSHFHTVDGNNNYIPAEGDAEQQLISGQGDPDKAWARVEIRAGIGPLCFVGCGVCIDDNTPTE